MNRAAGKSLSGEQLDRLRLLRSENVGPITYRQLFRRFGSAGAALEALPELARRGGRRRPIKIAPLDAAEREWEALEALGGSLLFWGEPDYPRPLGVLEDAPPILALLGDSQLLARPTVAVVGARNASANGRRFARSLAAGLTAQGMVVASGMARGIDASAHEGAMDGGTVAVLAGGVDAIYPAENTELYRQIVARGAILAESPLGVQPQARDFPRRNRIISGLALGVVVVEAAERSGSLITARLALEQGREVFAVPGSPLDPRARGTNRLIRSGATLVESADDVSEVLSPQFDSLLAEDGHAGPMPPPAPLEEQDGGEAARQEIIDCLAPTPIAVDELIRECHLSPALVSTVLLELELAGRLERHPGHKVSLAP